MIEEQFVSFDTARMLKEAGFDAPCYMQYSERGVQCNAFYPENFNADDWGCSCPTQALATRWLREVHGMHIEIYHRVTGYGYFITKIETNELLDIPARGDETQFDIYEEAFENALRKAIKLIEK